MYHNVHGAEDEPGDEDWLEHGEEDVIVDPKMDGVEVDTDGSLSKDGHRVGVGSNAEG